MPLLLLPPEMNVKKPFSASLIMTILKMNGAWVAAGAGGVVKGFHFRDIKYDTKMRQQQQQYIHNQVTIRSNFYVRNMYAAMPQHNSF